MSPPKHNKCVGIILSITKGVGSVSIAVDPATIQPLVSVTVTVYDVFADKVSAILVVSPLDHA